MARPDIEAIEKRWERWTGSTSAPTSVQDTHALLAYVAELEAFTAQIVTAPSWDVHDNFNCYFHAECDPQWVGPETDEGHWEHHPQCPVTKARTLLK